MRNTTLLKRDDNMKLLRAEINGCVLFKDKFVFDFVNSDSVRTSYSENEYSLQAYKIQPGIYAQVLLALTGLNATGKTTALELLSAIAQIILQGKSLNDSSVQRVFLKLLPLMKENKIEWNVFFFYQDDFYVLHSIITAEDVLSKNIEDGGFKYEFEELKKCQKKITGKNFNILENYVIDFNRSEVENNPYLKDDISIVSSFKGFKGSVFPLGQSTNFNLPAWVGIPAEEAIHVFDPNIENLSISQDKEGKTTSRLSFKNHRKFTYGGSPMGLLSLLSSGTIKGLTVLPGIIRALKLGGYVFIDEIENHFNKKIIEWFFSLFTDTRTNPQGACLVFSTHYPEILDSFKRKDNIYITRRDKENYCECVKYSDFIKRNELLKSKVILENVITGTAPRYQDLENGRKWIESVVNKEGV